MKLLKTFFACIALNLLSFTNYAQQGIIGGSFTSIEEAPYMASLVDWTPFTGTNLDLFAVLI